ncbi:MULTISPECIES: segregation and condensation protein A [Kocuria]|uniref:segregation and condensation protein A n=1 Tax=Kocuria TaxID=57493 RepID=UPI00031A0D02|nr:MULTISPECIES: ScpA family protein [Kocuria]WIW68317.1 ScpA family protein [Kocuria sp. ChxB]KUP27858.1 chromosome segregation protein ScpA [Kocuria rhizophila]MCT1544624.1 segregation/condensation protein A [Kocuria rhizophila]MCT2171003.1 segregation/condensation protein A [Kocuria rhizophila]MDA4828815.1 ScpA family protein [Kocuria rhizophila]
MSGVVAVPAEAPGESHGGFTVALENFQGPFDVLLSLIAKHELDITQVSLSVVTDEFIQYVRALQEDASPKALDEASEFLVVAATLLDLKAARLLPRGEVEDEYDVELLEARDLLFARLLQYKAFKEVAGRLNVRFAAESVRIARQVDLDPAITTALPPLTWTLTPEQLAHLAVTALDPERHVPEEVDVAHLHGAQVRVADEAEVLADILRDGEDHTFHSLVADAESTLVVVVRFLALLEMYRDRVVRLHQEDVLGALLVRWDGPEQWSAASLSSEYTGAEPETAPSADGENLGE